MANFVTDLLPDSLTRNREGQNWTGKEFITYGGNNKSYSDIFRSRLLDQRARIEFHYPGGMESGEDIITFIPFYENPEITETQTANYVEYNPIGRGSSMFAYTGTKSRKFKIKLTFTLPHLAMHDMGISRFMRVFMDASEDSQKLLFTSKSRHTNKKWVGESSRSLANEVAYVYHKLSVEENLVDLELAPAIHLRKYFSNPELKDPTFAGAIPAGATPGDFMPGEVKRLGKQWQREEKRNALFITEEQKIIDTLLFFITLLRTSVVNKVNNPIFGPPLLRLNFGTLYQSVPCICKSYNISWDEKAGYNLETLTPRKIIIDLTLDEVRVGNFGKYEPGKLISRDNLTGWESAVGDPYSTTDPLNLRYPDV